MRTNSTLTHNGILYISLGFTQKSMLQVLQLRKGNKNTLQMIVYDGTVYAGALFAYSPILKKQKLQTLADSTNQNQIRQEDSNHQHAPLPRHLDVIRVEATLHSKNQPLWINSLEIVRSGLTQILGRQIITLQEYMKRRRFLPVIEIQDNEKDQQSSKPSKRIKSNEYFNCQFQESSSAVNLSPLKCNGLQQEAAQQNIEIEVRAGPNQDLIVLEQDRSVQTLQKQNDPLEQQQQKQNKDKSLGVQAQSIASEQPLPINKLPLLSQRSIIQTNVHLIHPQQPKDQIQFDSQKTKPHQINHTNNSTIVSLLIAEDDDQVQIIQTLKRPKSQNLMNLMNQKHPNKESKHSKSITIKEKSFTDERILIKDLYERMHRFKLLCRINHIEQFITLKGNERMKMVLVDEAGDQIFCLLFQKALEKQNSIKLCKGKTYIFENGEVQKDQMGALSLMMPWSGIQQTKILMQSFNATKMLRVGSIQSLSPIYFTEKTMGSNSNSINNRRAAKEINICGIYMGMSQQAKLINNQFKVVGKLCDFQNQRCINFSLFVSQLTSFPREGGIVMSLHNMKVTQNQGIYRLQSGKRSYYLTQNYCQQKYLADLIELSKNQRWKQVQYKNLSNIVYVSRKIKQLNDLLINLLQGQNCYSQIDCNIVNIKQTKDFAACISCKKLVKQNGGLAAYCYNCRKIEKWTYRYFFIAQVADSTGSLDVKFTSDEIESFLNLNVEDYSSMPLPRRQEILELSTYQNILIRAKSEKMIGGSQHYVNRVQRVIHSRSLHEIRERSVEDKLKYKSVW